MSEVLKPLLEGLKKSPKDILNALIVCLFVWYLVQRDTSDMEKVKHVDLVAKQRIEHCHNIQEKSTDIMDKLNDTLVNHDKAFIELLYNLKEFKKALEINNTKLDNNSEKIDALFNKMTLLEATILESIEKSHAPNSQMIEIFQEIKKEIQELNSKIKKD